MKLEKPITIQIPNQVDPNTNKVVVMDPYVTDELKIIYLDNPSQKQYYVSIHPLQQPVMLFEGEEYHLDITKEIAQARIFELSKGDVQSYLQNFLSKEQKISRGAQECLMNSQ